MATKQNGVLATFTPTVSYYTNKTTAAALGQISATAWMMYTVPAATLMSGKLLVSNNTGSAANINVGLVEQTEVLQLATLASQPNDPNTGASYTGFGQLSFPSGTINDYATSIRMTYSNLSNGPFIQGEPLTWTNTNRGSGAAANMVATIQYVDAANNQLWLHSLTHPLALELPAGDTTFTGGTSGATCSIGTSYAGTNVRIGHSGKVRFYDSLTGRIFFNNREFRNNLDYEYLYMNDPNENREQNNNNLNRSNNRTWRPVATTLTEYNNAGVANNGQDTEFIDQNGVPLKISSAVQCAAEQFIVQDKQVADNDIFELSGLVLGAHQSIFVSSSAAVTFNLIGFEEIAEVAS